ncbi:MAG: HAD family hydrolase [Chloroflexota bacterium]
MLKGVLFDLGSTLQEFRHENWATLDRELSGDLYAYIAERGHADKLPPLDEFIEIMHTGTRSRWDEARETMRGRPLLDLLQPLFDKQSITGLRPEECLRPWYGRSRDNIYIEPDVQPTLEALRDMGLKLGLVSNTAWPAAAHDPDLEHFGIIELLPCRVYSCEFGWEKPAPQIFRAALDCLDLQPEEVAFVGDFLRYDIKGAQAVGMKGIWKQVPSRPSDVDDHTIVPDATIVRIGELPQVLQRLYNSAM